MDVTHIVLDELNAHGTVVDLPDSVAQALEATELVEVRPEPAGCWRLLPRDHVGVVRFEHVQVAVRPKDKVGLCHVLFYLGYAVDPGFRAESVVGSPDDDLWPALGHSLAQAAEQALRRGVLQGYRTIDEALNTVRGRVRFGDQLQRRPGLLVPIEITHDQFDVDITENRILLAAMTTMLGVPRLDDAVRRRLIHLCGRLAGVSRLQPGDRVPPWQPTRLDGRYHVALRLAELILGHASVIAGPGRQRMAAFVVNMWKVYEDFVTTALMEAMHDEPGSPRAQLPAYLAGDGDWIAGEVPMRIDLVHFDENGRPRAVLDAKYKAASLSGRYANADHYQMLAYCTALRVRRAWLIYAGGSGTRTRRIKNADIEIIEWPLDLTRPPVHVLSQVKSLAKDVATHLEAQPADGLP